MFTMALYDFLKDSFFLKFPISRENRNFWPITIRFDVGHPVLTLASLALNLIIKMQINEGPSFSIRVSPPPLCINFYIHGPNSPVFYYYSAQFNSM